MTPKSIDFRITIPGHFLKKQLLWIFLEFRGMVTWKSIDFRVTILLPGNQVISGFNTQKSINFRVSWPGSEILRNSYKSFLTEYIYKNQLQTICTYIGLWFEGKKIWGHPFCDLRESLPWSLKYFCEYLHENRKNIFENILGYYSRGPGTINSCKKPDIKNLMLLSL